VSVSEYLCGDGGCEPGDNGGRLNIYRHESYRADQPTSLPPLQSIWFVVFRWTARPSVVKCNMYTIYNIFYTIMPGIMVWSNWRHRGLKTSVVRHLKLKNSCTQYVYTYYKYILRICVCVYVKYKSGYKCRRDRFSALRSMFIYYWPPDNSRAQGESKFPHRCLRTPPDHPLTPYTNNNCRFIPCIYVYILYMCLLLSCRYLYNNNNNNTRDAAVHPKLYTKTHNSSRLPNNSI